LKGCRDADVIHFQHVYNVSTYNVSTYNVSTCDPPSLKRLSTAKVWHATSSDENKNIINSE